MLQHVKTYLILSTAVGLCLSGAASAQVSSQGGPIMYGSDHYAADQNAHTQTLDGRVEIQQNDARLRADHIVITHAPGPNGSTGFGEIITIDATGNVYYVTPTEAMRGDKAVYTKATDTMVVTGDVILQQNNKDVMTGNRLVDQVKAGTTTFDADPTTAGPGRVKGVFYPDNTPAKGAPAIVPPPPVKKPAN